MEGGEGGCPWVKRFSVFQVSFAAGTATGRTIYYLHLLDARGMERTFDEQSSYVPFIQTRKIAFF